MDLWLKLKAWARAWDGSRDASDEARRWADDEVEAYPMPVNVGEWKAAVEAAFDAGRQLEVLRNASHRRPVVS